MALDSYNGYKIENQLILSYLIVGEDLIFELISSTSHSPSFILAKEIGFTEPFRTKNKNGIKLAKEIEKKFKELNKQLDDSNRIVFTIMKPITLDLCDNTTYYTIPETNGRFVEIADNKGYVDPDFSFEFPNYDINKRHFKNDLSSIKKYDEAIEILIKDCIKRSGFMYDTFENYIDMKLDFMELQLDIMEEES